MGKISKKEIVHGMVVHILRTLNMFYLFIPRGVKRSVIVYVS